MRHAATLALIGCVFLVVGPGCIRSDLEEVEAERSAADAPVTSEETVIGETVTTNEGNEVTVLRFESGTSSTAGVTVQEAEVEICADRGGDGAPAAPEFFRAIVDEVGYRRPGGAAREPVLVSTTVPPGECARGWIPFPIRDGEGVVGVALLASTVVEWSLG